MFGMQKVRNNFVPTRCHVIINILDLKEIKLNDKNLVDGGQRIKI